MPCRSARRASVKARMLTKMHAHVQTMGFLLYSSEDFEMDGCPCMEVPSDAPGAYKLVLVSSSLV